ncbi:MAG: fructosamine kinase family protein [Nitrospinales bacterium]
MKDEIQTLLSQTLAEPIRILTSVAGGGGCISRTEILSLSNGRRVFFKSHPRPPQDFFRREAEGLDLLRSAVGAPRVPAVLALPSAPNPRFIVLEYLPEEPPGKDFYVNFGRALAALHRKTQDRYGLDRDNFIGKTPQKNTPEKDPIVFFRERRIRFQQELARKSRLLPAGLDRKLDKLCEKLDGLLDVTGERPALLHGDLWSGNCFAGPGQAPCIFDPAAHFGLREADLAMTELFGRLPQSFYNAYDEAFPLNPGYDERKDLFNLYHLLNHLNLFGGSYLSSVERIVNRFV